MADNREGGSGRRDDWRERESSIFSDDDDRWRLGSGRWSGERDRGSCGDDDRGFFERAGDEVRSWFGDEEAERRRERDFGDDDARSEFGDRDERGSRADLERVQGGIRGGGRFVADPGSGREEGARGRSTRGGGAFFGGQSGGRSPYDDNYRHWRDQQIRQFDREYDDYCRERQQQFEQDFDSWRTSRLTQGGTGGTVGNETGSQGTTFGGSPTINQDTASGGGADAPGSTVGAAEGETSSSSRGRGGRSRA